MTVCAACGRVGGAITAAALLSPQPGKSYCPDCLSSVKDALIVQLLGEISSRLHEPLDILAALVPVFERLAQDRPRLDAGAIERRAHELALEHRLSSPKAELGELPPLEPSYCHLLLLSLCEALNRDQ